MVFPFFSLELLGGSSLQEALWDYPMASWPGPAFVQVILVALTLLTPGVIDKLQSTECWVKKVLKGLQKTKCLKPCDWYLFVLMMNIENNTVTFSSLPVHTDREADLWIVDTLHAIKTASGVRENILVSSAQ